MQNHKSNQRNRSYAPRHANLFRPVRDSATLIKGILFLYDRNRYSGSRESLTVPGKGIRIVPRVIKRVLFLRGFACSNFRYCPEAPFFFPSLPSTPRVCTMRVILPQGLRSWHSADDSAPIFPGPFFPYIPPGLCITLRFYFPPAMTRRCNFGEKLGCVMAATLTLQKVCFPSAPERRSFFGTKFDGNCCRVEIGCFMDVDGFWR